MEQQKEASSLGMWVFLAQEIMFFGGLFLLYLIYRMNYYPAFSLASSSIDVKWGAINTVVLIGSSVTMAMAVHSAQLGHRKLLVLFLMGTIILGGVFLGIKTVEYKAKYDEHHIPGMDTFQFTPEADKDGKLPNGISAQTAEAYKHDAAFQRGGETFFSRYCVMTGARALPMSEDIGNLLPMVSRAWKGRDKASFFPPEENPRLC